MNVAALFTFGTLGLLIASVAALLIANGVAAARRKRQVDAAISAERARLRKDAEERRKCLH